MEKSLQSELFDCWVLQQRYEKGITIFRYDIS